MRKLSLLAVLVSGATVSLGLAAVPVAASADATTTTVAEQGGAVEQGGVLHVVMPWVSIPDNFNPLNPGGSEATAGGTGSALYEPLAYVNTYTGQLTPMLATAWAWSNDNTTLTVTTRTGVQWSDHKPFSANDVAFTFNYLRTYAALDTEGNWKTSLRSVTATGPDTVVFQYSTPDTVVLPFILGQLVVPQHIWSSVTDPTAFANTKPVGTGPFLLKAWNSTNVTYVKNPHYWMAGHPFINGIVMTALKSTAAAELALLNGDAAYTYVPIADPDRTYVAVHPASDAYWWPVTGLNLLYMDTQDAPFNDVVFREAVAWAINDNVVTDRAYFGAIPPGNGPVETGVTNGQDAEWVPSSLSSLEWTYNPPAALRLLKAYGYRPVKGWLVGPSGKRLPVFKILIGLGWTDYISIAQTIGQELLAIGVHTTIEQEPYNTYYSSAQAGTYDFLICWSNGNNATPYYEYYYLLDSAQSAAPGANAIDDYERYSSPVIDSALANFASTSSLSAQQADIVSIEKTVLTEVPVIALTGRPNFFDYSTRYFTGWPSASDPYNAGEAPDSFNGGAEQVYLNVRLR